MAQYWRHGCSPRILFVLLIVQWIANLFVSHSFVWLLRKLTPDQMIVLTGATGGLGSQVLKYLLTLVPPSDITVSLHNPAGLDPSVASTGITVRKGDYAVPTSLDAAFAGADKLLLVSYPSVAHELRVKHHVNAIEAAKRAGVKHVYYTSLAFGYGTKPESCAAVMQAHLDTEAYLRKSGLKYTIIREGLYNESYPLYFGFFDPAKDTDVYVPGDGPIAWASRTDLGEGTARLLALPPSDTRFDNTTLLLSGPASNLLTLAQLSSLISTILGREITLHIISRDEYVKKHLDESGKIARLTEDYLGKWATTFEAMGRGETGIVDPTLQELLGRPLKTMEESLREALNASRDKHLDLYATAQY
ncbi:NAD(P)-binding protein [Neolentinus lepideus HHB14362 ss-1]|uniref:NAD(P)-binding protein n=1 Tax=Neolentinus lepideus HHB14362 ss-1 TaxID=1314782 RepID=A0A165VFU9_9AGAM|nr:NAD(P)-binding protein [Neolentinus lepideus HHB14362 ss-1]